MHLKPLTYLLAGAALFQLAQAAMSDTKNVIIQFQKTSSEADRAKIIADVKAKGGQVKNEDSVNSKIFPFVSVTMPEEHFANLQSSLQGHDTIQNVEEDKEMRIQ